MSKRGRRMLCPTNEKYCTVVEHPQHLWSIKLEECKRCSWFDLPRRYQHTNANTMASGVTGNPERANNRTIEYGTSRAAYATGYLEKKILCETHSQIKIHWILPEHAPRKFCNNPAIVLIVLREIIPSFSWIERKRNASPNLDRTP